MTFHLYQINEVYSNADGSVQFIELLGTANGQEFLTEGSLTVTQGGVTHTFDPATDLPSSATNGKTVLFATAGFEALTGVAPDYTLPAGFLFTSGSQTIHWGVDTLSVPLLPTEGGLSVGQNGTTSAPNTPENFAGVSGSVPSNHAPAGADLLGDVFTGVGQPFSLTVPGNDFSDADNDPLTYTATLANNAALPSWLSFDSSSPQASFCEAVSQMSRASPLSDPGWKRREVVARSNGQQRLMAMDVSNGTLLPSSRSFTPFKPKDLSAATLSNCSRIIRSTRSSSAGNNPAKTPLRSLEPLSIQRLAGR